MTESMKVFLYSFCWTVFVYCIILLYGCYPHCNTNGVKCHYTPPEWHQRRMQKQYQEYMERYSCALKYIENRTYLMCPNTEGDEPHYLLIECESWENYCLPLEN
jgi:hypothetical protein